MGTWSAIFWLDVLRIPQSIRPIPWLATAVSNRDDFNTVRGHAIYNNVWKPLKQISTRSAEILGPRKRSIQNCTASVVDLLQEFLRCFMTSVAIPMEGFLFFQMSRRMNVDPQLSHSTVRAWSGLLLPTESSGRFRCRFPQFDVQSPQPTQPRCQRLFLHQDSESTIQLFPRGRRLISSERFAKPVQLEYP